MRYITICAQTFFADLLIPTPECKIVDVSVDDEFLILASDGIWDVISSVEAVKLTRQLLNDKHTCFEAAEELCEFALKLGSSDNVTVVIVQFIHQNVESS